MSELAMKMGMDLSVALMLGLTIYYCIKLNKRIQILQDSKSELALLIKQFDESTQQATSSITEIQKASKKINENIQAKLDKANYIADDLAFMIERGNKTADKMEGRIAGERMANKRAAEPQEDVIDEQPARAERAVKSARRSRSRADSRAEMQLEAANRATQNDKKGGIEAMMERISELKSGQPEETRQKRTMARMRTKSERDLAQALKDEKRG